jgi:1-acyl-sn-glycerol-3-phosphate acyltransferase
MLFLRSLLFNTGMITIVAVGSFVVALCRPFLRFERRFATASWFTRAVIGWLGVTCRLRHRIEGLHNIPDGPVIFLAKHQSAWETFALQSFLPPFFWVLKREVMWIPILGWGIATLNPIAIDRAAGRAAVEQIVQQGSDRLGRGRRVMIFPEGTRVAAGETRRFGMGGAVLAAENQCPVVPIAHDSGMFWVRRGFHKNPGTIHVVVGEPIATTGLGPEQINALAKAWIDETTAALERAGSAAQP